MDSSRPEPASSDPRPMPSSAAMPAKARRMFGGIVADVLRLVPGISAAGDVPGRGSDIASFHCEATSRYESAQHHDRAVRTVTSNGADRTEDRRCRPPGDRAGARLFRSSSSGSRDRPEEMCFSPRWVRVATKGPQNKLLVVMDHA